MDKWHNIKECGKFILKSYVSFILICLAIRIIEIITCSDLMLEESKNDYPKIAEGIFRGFVFDNSISGLILLLPVFVLGLLCTFGTIKKKILNGSAIFIGILFALSTAISVGNIQYITYKMANLCLADLAYIKEKPGETIGMITGEPLYLVFFIFGLILVAAVIFLIWRYAKKTNIIEGNQTSFCWQNLLITLLTTFICFAMARGNSKSLNPENTIGRPLSANFALFSDDAFLNIAAQSPTFNLIKEIPHSDRRIKTGISDEEALLYASNIQKQTRASLATDSCLKKKNVVMIMMESMSAHYMATFGNKKGLTPCLDSLFANSYAYYNAWSNGARTNNAIFSTQTSLPGCNNINMLETPLILKHTSTAPVLSANGYSTDFFVSHEMTYDNINTFFLGQPFDKIHSTEEYGFEEIHWGLRDSTLFSIALDSLNHLGKNPDKPFYTVILTCSNHPPYQIQEPYCDMYTDIVDCSVRYADASIDTFMKRASKEPWFENTIFVFTGDHGKIIGKPDAYTATSLNHIPIFFYGKDITPAKDSSLILQIDLEPTILGMLGIQCPEFSGLGINQTKMTRDTAVYTANDYFIVRTKDKAYYLNMNTHAGSIYNIKEDFTLSNCKKGNIPEFDKLINTQIQALYTSWRY